ncbi:unnamed protein product, partial [Urochloa humidicola]
QCRHSLSVAVAGGSGDAEGVVGFLATTGAGHEGPYASGSGQIRERFPEISRSLRRLPRDVFTSHGQSVLALGFSNVKFHSSISFLGEILLISIDLSVNYQGRSMLQLILVDTTTRLHKNIHGSKWPAT